jgi:hypothetical protein
LKITVTGAHKPVEIDNVKELVILAKQEDGEKKEVIHANEDFLSFASRLVDKRAAELLEDLDPMLIQSVETE